MSRRWLTVGLGSSAIGVLLVLAACADSGSESVVTPQDDASSPSTMLDGGPAVSTDDAGDAESETTSPDAARRVCSDQNFCHTELPKKTVLRSVWGDGAGTVWAVSDTGSILRWDGSAWNVHATDKTAKYFAVWGSGPTDVWVGGSSGVLHGTGASPASLAFSPVEAPGDSTIPINAIWGFGADDVWAVGGSENGQFEYPRVAKGRVLHYTSGQWELDPASDTGVNFSRVWGTAESGVWISGNSYYLQFPDSIYSSKPALGLYRREKGASSFEAFTIPADPDAGAPVTLETANESSDTSIWLFARSSGYVLGAWHGTSADNGQSFSWTFTSRAVDFTLHAIWGTSPTDTWAVGDYGRIRHWDGTAWQQAALATSALPEVAAFYGIWAASKDDFWVVGDNIALHKTAK